MCFTDLRSQTYLFQFFHELDVTCIERGRPWTFDRHVLISRRIGTDEHPLAKPLYELSMWVQIHGLLVGFRSENDCFSIGGFVGKYAESDARNFDGT